jgi:hypothetical protein
MEFGRWLRISIWAVGGLIGLMAAALVVDSGGPDQRTYGTILSTRFVEGMTTSIDVNIGDMRMPLRTEVPGAWLVTIESPVLGRIEVAIDEGTLHRGQRVNLQYHVGRLTGDPQVVGLRLESEPFGKR